jgi:hypothetical protein
VQRVTEYRDLAIEMLADDIVARDAVIAAQREMIQRLIDAVAELAVKRESQHRSFIHALTIGDDARREAQHERDDALEALALQRLETLDSERGVAAA